MKKTLLAVIMIGRRAARLTAGQTPEQPSPAAATALPLAH